MLVLCSETGVVETLTMKKEDSGGLSLREKVLE